jgi:beta-galactosidase
VEGILGWTLPFEAGELKAIGLEDGRPVAEFRLQTAGAPARIQLELVATGQDGVEQVAFFVVDAQGHRVPDAAHRLRFDAQGLEILGIGNGNLADVDDPKDAEHAAHEGRGLAILRRTGDDTPARLRVTAAGLTPAALNF